MRDYEAEENVGSLVEKVRRLTNEVSDLSDRVVRLERLLKEQRIPD